MSDNSVWIARIDDREGSFEVERDELGPISPFASRTHWEHCGLGVFVKVFSCKEDAKAGILKYLEGELSRIQNMIIMLKRVG